MRHNYYADDCIDTNDDEPNEMRKLRTKQEQLKYKP